MLHFPYLKPFTYALRLSVYFKHLNIASLWTLQFSVMFFHFPGFQPQDFKLSTKAAYYELMGTLATLWAARELQEEPNDFAF